MVMSFTWYWFPVSVDSHRRPLVGFLIETDAQYQISSNLRSRLQKRARGRFFVPFCIILLMFFCCCQYAITFSSNSNMWLCLPTCVDDTMCQCHQQRSVRFSFTQKHILYFKNFIKVHKTKCQWFNSTLLTLHGHNLTCSGSAVRICSAFLVRPVSKQSNSLLVNLELLHNQHGFSLTNNCKCVCTA